MRAVLSIAFDACPYAFSQVFLVLFLSTSPALQCLPLINEQLMVLHFLVMSCQCFIPQNVCHILLRFLSYAHCEGQKAQRHYLPSVELVLSLDQVAEGRVVGGYNHRAIGGEVEWRPPLLYVYPLGHPVPCLGEPERSPKFLKAECERQCAVRCAVCVFPPQLCSENQQRV